jgi:hypothetical protein
LRSFDPEGLAKLTGTVRQQVSPLWILSSLLHGGFAHEGFYGAEQDGTRIARDRHDEVHVQV